MKDIQAVVDVLAQKFLLDGLGQRPIGGRDDPHIHRNLTLSAQPSDCGLFENAQQFWLHGDGHFRDFVQEQSALIGVLGVHPGGVPALRCKAFFVPKQFVLISVSGNAAQLMATKALAALGLSLCSAEAPVLFRSRSLG